MALEQVVEKWRTNRFHRDRSGCDGEYLSHNSQLDLARCIAEWQRKQFTKDSCCWLDKNLTNSPDGELIVKYGGVVAKGTLIREFRKAMKFKDDAEGEE